MFCDSKNSDRILTLNSLNRYLDDDGKEHTVMPVVFSKASKFANSQAVTSLNNRVNIFKDLMSFRRVNITEQAYKNFIKAIQQSQYTIKLDEYGNEVVKEIKGWGADIIDAVLYSHSQYTNILLNTIRIVEEQEKEK